MCSQNSEKYVFLVRSTLVTSNKLKLHQFKYVNIKEKGIWMHMKWDETGTDGFPIKPGA
jgi:hypothetical protein